ncbi:MAG TPA: iron-sulfur cluster repair di-iron protein [Terracidiphilus sp.]|nr:iron-sulfur cluster repair di-iron protein [Terracidiphilus sp.]
MITTAQTVREIALEQPSSIRVFESFGIDYCCGGRKPLAEACTATNVEVDRVIAALEAAAANPASPAEDWTHESLRALIGHIVATHHAYVQRELPRLATLAQKVVNRHGDTMPEVSEIQSTLAQLDEELTHHLAKEEIILFPHIVNFELARNEGRPKPTGCFGTVANPIQMMTQEHDAAGTLLARMRRLSQNFIPPAHACPTFHAFYSGLREFEQDLHLHIHLENNILFPRAIELELAAA